LAVLPLAIGWGSGAEMQQPLAIVLIGGLITSTILTLVVLPSLYLISESFVQNRARSRIMGPHKGEIS
jgi:Cu/Ag efflux pump CusA